MSKKLILFPFGGNTREALLSIFAVNQKSEEWTILGFLDDDPALQGKECMGIKVIGTSKDLGQYQDAYFLGLPGNPDTYLNREKILQGLDLKKSRMATIIHPTAIVSSDAKIGHNVLIMPHVVISSNVRIGNNSIVLSNTTVAHDSQIGDYCSIGNNVVISGYVRIENACYIGSGVSIRNNIVIGEKSLVGIGSNVVKDVLKDHVVAGNPAKIIRKIKP